MENETLEQMDAYTTKAIEMIMEYGPNLILALLTLFIGLWVIKSVTRLTEKVLKKRNVDESLVPFLRSMINIIFKAILVISVIEMVGVETTSFVAILGAAGLAVGMALSGTLQNFAGGVMILIFKPYKVGDFIETQGHMGIVKEIQIFNTILNTVDNKTIIVPNAPISSSSMTNFSTESTRRVDMTFGIGYNDDIDKAKDVLKTLVEADGRVLKDPQYFIAVAELADSSVNFVVRVWVNSSDYWGVFHDMQENVKKAFDKENISIPYPQMDVHQYQGN